MRRLKITLDDVVVGATLYEGEAPETIGRLWRLLPISDRTIPTQWSGRAWRTEGDYAVMPDTPEVENVADHLAAGDVIFYPRMQKIGIAYGDARWLGPFCLPRQVSLIGRIDENLEGFVEASMKIIYQGPLAVRIERAD